VLVHVLVIRRHHLLLPLVVTPKPDAAISLASLVIERSLEFNVLQRVPIVSLCDPRLLGPIEVGNVVINQSHQTPQILGDDGRALAVEEIQIFVQNFDKQVHLMAHAGIRDLE